jgi:hypothetical protein
MYGKAGKYAGTVITINPDTYRYYLCTQLE